MRRVVVFLFLSTLAAWAIDKETAMGQQMIKSRKWKIVETPDSAAVLVQRLSPQRSIDVKTIESDQPLANNFPGGIVYISTAFIQSATSAELAAILAHQIAHTAAHHGMSSGDARIYFMGSSNGICARGVDAGALRPVAWKPHFAANEAEADLLATQYLERAGYEAVEVQPIFDRLLRSVPAPRKAPTLLR